MFILFLIYLLPIVNALANTLTSADPPQDSKNVQQRTLFAIVWSCISTIVICAWTSVHPNVPPPNRWKARWNRLRLMFWMVIAPELVLAWAVRQFFAAKTIRDKYNERRKPDRWTLKHGYLLAMGGFTIVDPAHKYAKPKDRGGSVLTVDYFEQHPDIDLPHLTSEDIEDRSKGDALSKIIAILQTSWFIAQCIARGRQRLALTELELVTLALASLNAVTFVIWWHKPLAMQEPLRIYLKKETVKRQQKYSRLQVRYADVSFINVITSVETVNRFFSTICKDPCDEGSSGFFIKIFALPLLFIYLLSFPIFVLFPFGIVFLLNIIKTYPAPRDASQNTRGLLAARIVVSSHKFLFGLISLVSNFVGNRKIFTNEYSRRTDTVFDILFSWFLFLPFLFLLLSLFILSLAPFFILVFLVSFIFTAVFGIITTSTIRPSASHVPSFYAPNTTSDRWSRMVVFALFGVIFGGLHCIGWDFQFPTRAEQLLWRFTSLAIAVIPLIVAPIDFLLANSRDIKTYGTFVRVGLMTLDFIMTVLLFVYVPARLSLIAQALALLRHQPASALIAIDWAKYVPHLFSS